MKKRTEDQIVLQEFEVVLGGKKRTGRVKSIRDNREFRRRLGELIGDLLAPLFDPSQWPAGEDGEKPETPGINFAIRKLMPALFADAPEGLMDLLWLYAPELREWEDVATEDELLDAALEVLELSIPLAIKIVQRLQEFGKRMGITLSARPSSSR